MQFCEFINKLKKYYACSNQERFVLDIFAALCGDPNPIISNDQCGYSHCLPDGLSGGDPTYRKMLFSGRNKKYRGLSSPIKAYVIQNSNKDAFIAYCEMAVSTEAFKGLCDDFGISTDTGRDLLFEGVFGQFLEFAKARTDSASDAFIAKFVTDQLLNPPEQLVQIEEANAPPDPIYSGDNFSLVRQVPSHPRAASFYNKFTHHWVIKNSGVAVWDGRCMKFVNVEQTPLKMAVTHVEIKKTPPNGEVTITVDVDARHVEGTHEIILDMEDAEGRVCFPDKRAELHLLVTVGWKNKT